MPADKGTANKSSQDDQDRLQGKRQLASALDHESEDEKIIAEPSAAAYRHVVGENAGLMTREDGEDNKGSIPLDHHALNEGIRDDAAISPQAAEESNEIPTPLAISEWTPNDSLKATAAPNENSKPLISVGREWAFRGKRDGKNVESRSFTPLEIEKSAEPRIDGRTHESVGMKSESEATMAVAALEEGKVATPLGNDSSFNNGQKI